MGIGTPKNVTHSLNPFSLDYSVHFFSPVLFSHFITQYFYLFRAKEGKNEKQN